LIFPDSVKWNVITGADEYKNKEEIPAEPPSISLFRKYPNPDNPITKIPDTLPKTDYVMLKVVDLQGRETATWVDQFQNGGEYTVGFDASSLASGVYFSGCG
jgi:hypothetical protein